MAPRGKQNFRNESEDEECPHIPELFSTDAGSSQKRGCGKAVNKVLHELVRKKGKVSVEIPITKWRPVTTKCVELTREAGVICRYNVPLINENGEVISDWRLVPGPSREVLHNKLKERSNARKKGRTALKVQYTGGSKPFVCYLEMDQMIKEVDEVALSDDGTPGETPDQIAFRFTGEQKHYTRGLQKGEVVLLPSSRHDVASQLEAVTQRAQMAEMKASQAREMVEEYQERLECQEALCAELQSQLAEQQSQIAEQQSQLSQQQSQIDMLMTFMKEQQSKCRLWYGG